MCWQKRLAVRVKIGLGRDSVDSLDSSVVRPKHRHGNPERRNHIQIRFRRRTAATPHGKTAIGDEIMERSESHAATKPRLQLPRHYQSHVQTRQPSRLKLKSLERRFYARQQQRASAHRDEPDDASGCISMKRGIWKR